MQFIEDSSVVILKAFNNHVVSHTFHSFCAQIHLIISSTIISMFIQYQYHYRNISVFLFFLYF